MSSKYVQDELATIESLLSKAHGQTDEIRRTTDELEGELKQLVPHGNTDIQRP